MNNVRRLSVGISRTGFFVSASNGFDRIQFGIELLCQLLGLLGVRTGRQQFQHQIVVIAQQVALLATQRWLQEAENRRHKFAGRMQHALRYDREYDQCGQVQCECRFDTIGQLIEQRVLVAQHLSSIFLFVDFLQNHAATFQCVFGSREKVVDGGTGHRFVQCQQSRLVLLARILGDFISLLGRQCLLGVVQIAFGRHVQADLIANVLAVCFEQIFDELRLQIDGQRAQTLLVQSNVDEQSVEFLLQSGVRLATILRRIL